MPCSLHDPSRQCACPAVCHRFSEQLIGLSAPFVRAQVVGLVEVDGIDRALRKKRYDVDGMTGGFLQRLQFVRTEDDVSVFLELVTLDDIGPFDHRLVSRAIKLLPDARTTI